MRDNRTDEPEYLEVSMLGLTTQGIIKVVSEFCADGWFPVEREGYYLMDDGIVVFRKRQRATTRKEQES